MIIPAHSIIDRKKSIRPLSCGAALLAFSLIVIGLIPRAIAQGNAGVNFASADAVIELLPDLKPYHTPGIPDEAHSRWYMTGVSNDSVRPSTRILLAGQPAGAGLKFFPRATRPAITQVASSDSAVIVELTKAYGRHAWRVTLPPATTAQLAVRVDNGYAPPSVLAWTEPALVAHNHQVAIYVSAVAGLIGAVMLVMAGLAFMTGHIAPRWAAAMLGGVFVAHLSSTGMFDAGWMAAVGGPYGATALFAGLALAAAFRLTDAIAPVEQLWRWAKGRVRQLVWGLVALSVLAFLGLPGATALLDVVLVAGSAAITAYLVHRGRLGSQPARVVAPSAAIFALVMAAAALTVLGGFVENIMAPMIIGGFVAAGAVLLALAIAAGEGLAVIPAFQKTDAAGANPVAVRPPEPPPTPLAQLAMQAIGSSHQGVFDYDFRNGLLRLSADASALIGIKGAETFPQTAWFARIHPDDRDIYKQAMTDYRAHPGLAFRIEFRARSESGRYPWFELRATMIGEGKMATRCLGLIADVTARKESEAAVTDRGLHDALTGLGNRTALTEALERMGDGLATCIFALLDLDRFKAIHASLGDEGGDAVLKAVSERLTKRFGGLADLYRVGGDAFALVFPRPAGSAEAMGVELVDVCAAPFVVDGRNVFAPASVGMVDAGDANDPLHLLRNAELALNAAKRQGGGCARVYHRDLETGSPADPVALESELREALAAQQLELFWQPIIRLSDGTVAGFEALLRWRHAEKGLLAPDEFVAHSEQTGLIVALGQFALTRAAEALARWQKYFPVQPPVFASVNVSRRQLRDAGFEPFLKNLLQQKGIKSGTLKLEITESAVAGNGEMHDELRRLSEMGAGLALDDFGTGLSGLKQLKDQPFEIIKIDGSFLKGDNRDNAAVVSSIIALAHELNRAVVAEGVESQKDAIWLRDLNCEYGQGFYFAEPMPESRVGDFLARHARIGPQSGAAGLGG